MADDEIKRALRKEYAQATSSESLLNQAVKRIRYERAKSRARGHVKETLSRLERAQKGSPFQAVLQKAMLFDEDNLKKYWPSEWWSEARPTGFCDAAETTIEIVIVGDTYHWRMQSIALIRACQKIPGLEHVRKVRLREIRHMH